MAPKRRTTRLNPETTPAATAATTTTVTNAQLQAMIDQGVTAVLAARDANTNGVDSHNSGTGARRNERATRECTYPDFMKCQPLNFKGTEGVVELTQWIEKMETVFRISNCSVENQIKFSTCTLLGNALTWWNSHYCPRTEIKKLEVELWELKVKGTDVIGYNQCFQELALLCGRMFPEDFDKIEKYVGGLPDTIHGSVVASKPKTMQEETKMAIEVMDKRIRTFADCQRPTCYECGVQGHFKRECPKLKNNNNQGNQLGGGNAPAKVYAVGHARKNPDSNVVMGTLLLNNRYASILFDTGADRSFGLYIKYPEPPILHRLNAIELGSFDAIIGMDWMVKYQAIIVCAKKIVRISWGNETLIVHGDGSNQGHEARLHIISYTKKQEYMLKGCPVFLANVNTKETEDKSKDKRLEDVPIV
ncbi:putative reverse transcriptase domain-containing protein [Tanacetum coccineum]